MSIALPIVLFSISGHAKDAFIGFIVFNSPYLLSSYLSVFVSKFKVKQLILFTELMQFGLCLLLYLLVNQGNFILAYIALAMLGLISAISETLIDFKILPTVKSSIITIKSAYAYNGVVNNISFLLAPLTASIFIFFDAPILLLAVNSITFLFSALLYFYAPANNKRHEKPDMTILKISKVIGEVFGNRSLRYLSLALCTFNLGAGAMLPAASVVLYANGSNPGEVIFYATLIAMLLSFLLNKYINSLKTEMCLVVFMFITTLASVFLNTRYFVFSFVVVFAIASLINITGSILRYSLTDDSNRVEVNLFLRGLIVGSTPISGLLFSINTNSAINGIDFGFVPILLSLSLLLVLKLNFRSNRL